MKKTCMFVCALAVTAVMRASVASATPSTQIWIPSTDIQPYKVLHYGADAYIKTERMTDGTREGSVINNGLTVGVLPFEKIQAEVGIDHRNIGTGDGPSAVSTEIYNANPFYFNAKVGIPEDALFKGSPALAIGGFDFGTKQAVTDFNIVYALAATSTPVGRFSVGYFEGNDKLLLDHKGEKDNKGVLASWDRTMKEISDKLWLAVDYQGSNSSYGALSAGAAWAFTDKVSVIVGYDIYNNRNLKPTATVQLDINF